MKLYSKGTNTYCSTIHNSQKKWNQFRYTVVNEWIKKMCYIYTMEYYSTINDVLWYAAMWKELNMIMLSETRSTQKDPNHLFSLICEKSVSQSYRKID
jgi:hypothetical protein